MLIVGPNDAAARVLRALLVADGLGASLASTRGDALEAARSPLLKVVLVHAPAPRDHAWIRELLQSPALSRLRSVELEGSTPEALEGAAAAAAGLCAASRASPRPPGKAPKGRSTGTQAQVEKVRARQTAARAEVELRQVELRAEQDAAARHARAQVERQRAEFLRIRERIRRRLFPSGPPGGHPRFPGDDEPPFQWLRPHTPPD